MNNDDLLKEVKKLKRTNKILVCYVILSLMIMLYNLIMS